MEAKTVKYKILDPRAKAPAYATPGSVLKLCLQRHPDNS